VTAKYIDYGTEPVEQYNEARLLLHRIAVAVLYAAVLWALGAIALEITGGEEASQTIPTLTSQVVYVEGECLIY
jgi:hypothetical protein